MTMHTQNLETVRLTGWARWGVLALAIMCLLLLGLAAWLEPSPTGYGTHENLGLPRCTVVELFGIRCPSCGMTTAWAHLVRGNLWSSLQANVGGTALGLLAIVFTPWLLVSAWRGDWWLVRPNEWILLTLLLGVFVVTVLDWSVRIRGG